MLTREVFKILERDKTGLHKQLSGRFEKEYWHIPDDLKNAGFKILRSKVAVFMMPRELQWIL